MDLPLSVMAAGYSSRSAIHPLSTTPPAKANSPQRQLAPPYVLSLLLTLAPSTHSARRQFTTS
jgi:hypothetical protein